MTSPKLQSIDYIKGMIVISLLFSHTLPSQTLRRLANENCHSLVGWVLIALSFDFHQKKSTLPWRWIVPSGVQKFCMVRTVSLGSLSLKRFREKLREIRRKMQIKANCPTIPMKLPHLPSYFTPKKTFFSQLIWTSSKANKWARLLLIQ